MTKELLTITEVCAETNIGKTMVYRLINSGQLLAVKLGKKTLIRRADMETWLSSLNNYNVRGSDAANAQAS